MRGLQIIKCGHNTMLKTYSFNHNKDPNSPFVKDHDPDRMN